MKKFILAATFCCQLSCAFFSSSLTGTIDSFIHQTNPHLVAGVEIRSLPSGKILYQKNPHFLLKPASLQKIPVGLMAYLKLGPTYKFETSLGEKEGSVYLRFRGDPTFTLSHLEELFRTYKKKKGCTISGDILINEERVPVFPHGDGWSVESTRFLYGALISPININKNAICFRLIPAKTPQQKPLIIYDKDQPFYRIENNSISAVCSDASYIERCDLELEEEISIKGCVPYGSPAFKICLPIKEHRFKEYVRKCIQLCLKKIGIHLKGKILFRSFPEGKTSLVACHQSEPLSLILQEGLKNSDNTIMESLFIPFMLKKPEKFRKNNSIHEFMREALQEELKIDLSRSSLTDGAGLSHHNLISPHQIADLLETAFHHPSLGEKWFGLMAIGGNDGTLETKFQKLPKNIKVIAKTGTLTGVRNLAGYILKDGKPKYLFVFMMQNFSEKESIYESLHDKIITYLSQID